MRGQITVYYDLPKLAIYLERFGNRVTEQQVERLIADMLKQAVALHMNEEADTISGTLMEMFSATDGTHTFENLPTDALHVYFGVDKKELSAVSKEAKQRTIKYLQHSACEDAASKKELVQTYHANIENLLLRKKNKERIREIIDSQDKIFPIGNEHYGRFLYRLSKFVEIYPWTETIDFLEELDKFRENNLVVNVPEREAKQNAEHGEAQLERMYCLSNKCNYDVIDHQLPVHLFNQEVKKEYSVTPNSFLDIWSIKDNELNIFELKLPTNKKVGIISELMFYVNVMTDIMNHNILIPTSSEYRSFDNLYEMYQNKTCAHINGIMLADELHPIILQKKEKVLAIINDGYFRLSTKYIHQKTCL